MVAAWDGHEAVVKLLLKRDDIRTDIKDRGNDNGIWWKGARFAYKI
jgi:hypothetical protein